MNTPTEKSPRSDMSRSAITVSVIIPTFNRADLLRETVQAVLDQTRPPDEILIVDDGSDDHTQTVIASFADAVRMLSKPNSGKADSLNQAIAATSGTHIWIVDDDDLPRPDALATLTLLMSENKGAELTYGRHIRFEQADQNNPKTYQETGYWDTRPSEYFLIATMEDFFVHQPAMLVARSLYNRAGPFNTDMIASEDYDMLIRLAAEGQSISTDKIIFEQRVHAGVRGQKGHQFAAADRNAKWIDYDQRIFKAAFDRLPLTAYLPGGGPGEPLSAALTRTAQIQRASIMARKKLWDHALQDLRAVADGEHQSAFNEVERNSLRRALLSKYGCDEVLTTPQIKADLKQLAATGPLGGSLVRGLGRSLVWHFRTEFMAGRPARAMRFAALFLSLR